MTLWSQVAGWMRCGASANRCRASVNRRNVVLRLEQLEDRMVPSGGPGPTSTSGGSGSSGGPPAIVSTAPADTFTINLSAVSQAHGPTPLQVLLTGYPIPPLTGPGQSGSMLVVNDPSVLASLGNSTVALLPVSSPSGSGSTNLTLTLVNTTTGAQVDVPVTVVPTTTSGSPGSSGSTGSSGSSSTLGSAGPTLNSSSPSTSGSSASTGSTTTTSGPSVPSPTT
jgi:hypothetical protein